jgi:hypothetical protein
MELYGIREETSLSLILKILIRAAISRNFVSGEERGRLQIVIPCKLAESVCRNRIPCESPRWLVKALHNQAQTAQAKERWNAQTAMFKFNSQRTHPLDRRAKNGVKRHHWQLPKLRWVEGHQVGCRQLCSRRLLSELRERV